jgi:hypothetical protein
MSTRELSTTPRQPLGPAQCVTKRATRLFTCNTTFPAYTQTLACKMAAQHLGIRCEVSHTRDPRYAGEPTNATIQADNRAFGGDSSGNPSLKVTTVRRRTRPGLHPSADTHRLNVVPGPVLISVPIPRALRTPAIASMHEHAHLNDDRSASPPILRRSPSNPL